MHSNTNNNSNLNPSLKNEEQIINLEVELLTGETITISGTRADILMTRANLVLEGKLPNYMEFDEEAINNNLNSQDLTRWEFRLQGYQYIDTKAVREEQRESARKKEELMEDIAEAFQLCKVTIVNTINSSKEAIYNIFVVSEEKMKNAFSKKGLEQTGKFVKDIIEQGVSITLPEMSETFPHIKNQITLTSKQLFSIISNRIKSSKNKTNDEAN